MEISNDTHLSPHFTLGEFVRSATADAKKIDNRPTSLVICNIMALCYYTLEPLRSALWGDPLIINSGYRCPALNAAVGGVATSQHMIGEAADIRCENRKEAEQMIQCLENGIEFDQAIIETDGKSVWLHVSNKLDTRKNRHKVIMNLVKK